MTEQHQIDIGHEVERYRKDARAVWEIDRIEDSLDAYTLARVYEDAFGDNWKDTGEPGTKEDWFVAMGLYGLARHIVEHCWGVRSKSVWWLIRKTYIEDGGEDGMRKFFEALEGGYFDEEKKELVGQLSKDEVREMIEKKGQALKTHDAVWEVVSHELLEPGAAAAERAFSERERWERETGL